jgi:hypothetical protein
VVPLREHGFTLVGAADPCPAPPAPDIVAAVPATLSLIWDAPPAADLAAGPLGYTAFLDGQVAASILQSAAPCAATCSTRIIVAAAGAHTVAITSMRREADGSLVQSPPWQGTFTLGTP